MQGRSPCPRSAERGILLCLLKRRRGSKGEPSPWVPPFSLLLCVCAVSLGGFRCPVLRFDPISLVLAQRNGVEPPKKSAFDASTSPWWARPPLPFGRKPQRDRSVRQVGLYIVGRPGTQVSLTQSAVMLGLRVRGRGGRDPTPPVAAPISAFLWGSTPFLCARAKKWGGTGSRGRQLLPNKTAHS